ncbi:hypothetical protein KAR91_53010 [Candidatus Pacearchaeota archaeon]|nr:hypothetical protein [Candidatus Pacearchaeota archaeon]
MKKLIRSWKIWKCRRHYGKLHPDVKALVDFLECNPEQKIKRGDFNK